MAYDVSSDFQSAMLSTNPKSIIRQFTFVGSDLTPLVKNFATVNRNATEVVGDSVTFTLNNASQVFNSYITSKELFYTQVCTLLFGYSFVGSTETIGLFSGQLTKAAFNDMEVKLTFDNRLSFLKRTKIGTDESPVSFTNSDHNPADLAWYVVTSYAGLDSTEGTTNVDIDYTSWNEWKTLFNTESVTVRAKFTGEDVIDVLDRVRELTDSVIYVDQDNKLFFNRWIGLPTDSFTFVDSTITRIKGFNTNGRDLLNLVKVQHGYDPDTSSWTSVVDPITQFSNPGFEAGDTSSWVMSLNGSADASFGVSDANPQEGTYNGVITIIDDGDGAFSDIQISPNPVSNFSYIANHAYAFSFWAFANSISNVQVKLTDVNCNLRDFAQQETFNVTSPLVWYNFSYNFTPTITSSARLSFFIGTNSDTSIAFDVVSLSDVTISAFDVSSDSQSIYGVYEKIYKDTAIWYPNSRSAFDLAKRVAFRRNQPNVALKAMTPLIGATANVGDTGFVTWNPYSLDGAGFNINGYKININTGEMEFDLDQGFGFGGGRASGFVLDDSYYGLLDQNYNYLL